VKDRATRTSSRRCAAAAAIALLVASSACGPKDSRDAASDGGVDARIGAPAGEAGVADAGSPRIGMAWIPPGLLRAGTPPNRIPRIADEEMPGAPVELGGFYIDLLPWPNEPNAIPTSNVSRDEAEQLCASRGKRLCSELEWERACKGPESATYEYGDVYRKDVCGTGITIEQASRRPTGEHAGCKSRFGVAEMHGGPFEWTSSAWGRGSRDAAQGVLRGGNSVAGELVGRCANAIARAPAKKAPTMGFRCCSGPKNTVEVKLDLVGTPSLVMSNPVHAAPWQSALAAAAGTPAGAVDARTLHAWSWVPVANEELLIALGCTEAPRSCGLVVVRPHRDVDAGAGDVLVSAATGKELAEVVRNGDARHLRFRALDVRGVFGRDLTYVYGKIDIAEPTRR
jgi:formylglycine-generating enzyme required for sulfatase activity